MGVSVDVGVGVRMGVGGCTKAKAWVVCGHVVVLVSTCAALSIATLQPMWLDTEHFLTPPRPPPHPCSQVNGLRLPGWGGGGGSAHGPGAHRGRHAGPGVGCWLGKGENLDGLHHGCTDRHGNSMVNSPRVRRGVHHPLPAWVRAARLPCLLRCCPHATLPRQQWCTQVPRRSHPPLGPSP